MFSFYNINIIAKIFDTLILTRSRIKICGFFISALLYLFVPYISKDMKKILAFTIILYFINSVSAQHIKPEPLILQGKITNCPEKILKIFFEDENDKLVIDTIKLNNTGEFYLKTYKIKKPQRTSIQQNSIQLNNIYVAPGYNLTITGDGLDYLSLLKSKKISGIGSESNQYLIKIDSMRVVKMDTTQWYNLKLESLLPSIKKKKALEDSVVNAVFNRKPIQDKYFVFFKKMIQIDNESMALYMLLEHIALNQYSYETITTLVRENMPKIFLSGISKDEYLASEDYKTWLLGTYVDYTKQLDKLKDSTLAKQPNYGLIKIDEVYHGKVKDFYLYKAINSSIVRSGSIEKLNSAKKDVKSYFSSLKNQAYRKDLLEAFGEKEKQLMLLQIGKPAPKFTLLSHTGKTYDLANFKGKVIYLDLWASWCSPCRAEIPNFKRLYSKYKDNDKIAFIGISVFDGEKEWRKALEQDKPDWLQLYDKDGIVARSYVANAIPKYILIDKNGNVVNFDAPGPGKVEEIEKLISQEIAKKAL